MEYDLVPVRAEGFDTSTALNVEGSDGGNIGDTWN
jgi:hypothetical protein